MPLSAELGHLGELDRRSRAAWASSREPSTSSCRWRPWCDVAACAPRRPPRFPSVTRDVSFWSDVSLSADAQRAGFLSADEPLLKELAVLEDFRAPKYVPLARRDVVDHDLSGADGP